MLIELDLLVFTGKLYLTTVQFPQHPTHLRQYIWFHLWIWNSRSFSAAAEILAVKLLPFVPAICLQIPGPVGQHTSTAAKLSTELRNWGKVPTSAFSSVVKSHHKFMLASYMMQIAIFLAILHHNASFYNFCIIINSFHCLIFSKYWRVIVVSVSHHSAAGCGWWARLAGAF